MLRTNKTELPIGSDRHNIKLIYWFRGNLGDKFHTKVFIFSHWNSIVFVYTPFLASRGCKIAVRSPAWLYLIRIATLYKMQTGKTRLSLETSTRTQVFFSNANYRHVLFARLPMSMFCRWLDRFFSNVFIMF